MKIAIFGTGYVGLVSGACFAGAGHQVTCVDIDEEKIQKLRMGQCPIFEKDLAARLRTGMKNENLFFTTDSKAAIHDNDILFIAVGTPSKRENGDADLSAVFAVAEVIRDFANSPKIVIQKSTVPVGTGDVLEKFLNDDDSRVSSHKVASNPETLKEGSAVADFERPDRVIVGSDDQSVRDVLTEMYAPFMKTSCRIIYMSRPSAELSKIAANTMLAMRISSMNLLSQLAERTGADIDEVRLGVGSDPRISPAFLFAGGAGFGGSCFPKDVRALCFLIDSLGLDGRLFEQIMQVNHRQRTFFTMKIFDFFNWDFSGRKIAIWGLSFKPGTDDVRDAMSLELIPELIEYGAMVCAFDRFAEENFRSTLEGFFSVRSLTYSDSQYETLRGADALVILTDEMKYRSLDFDRMSDLMKSLVVFDGKNLYDPKVMAENGVDYFCVGRPRYPVK